MRISAIREPNLAISVIRSIGIFFFLIWGRGAKLVKNRQQIKRLYKFLV